jgi:hypothetical protein
VLDEGEGDAALEKSGCDKISKNVKLTFESVGVR